MGMSGSSTCAVQAETGKVLTFSPGTQYWVTFGSLKQGQVMTPGEVSNAVRIIFPDGIFSMNAVFNEDGTWSITQGKD